jgi:hypothetical protein
MYFLQNSPSLFAVLLKQGTQGMYGLGPIQKTPFTLQLSNFCHVLTHLKTAFVGPVCSPHGKVANEDKFSTHLNPEFRGILCPRPE